MLTTNVLLYALLALVSAGFSAVAGQFAPRRWGWAWMTFPPAWLAAFCVGPFLVELAFNISRAQSYLVDLKVGAVVQLLIGAFVFALVRRGRLRLATPPGS